MTQDWARWQGQVVDGEFRLDQYLGGTDQSGVYLTAYAGQKAAIKIRPVEPRSEPGAALSHPRLLRIFRTGRWEQENSAFSYVVMEFADVALSSVVPERALEPEEAAETLTPVLEGLAYLHAGGLIHGRLKPSNILSAGEQLKLSSDGLQRSGEASALSGERGPYDAPEIAEGRVSPAADVWSLGILLVEALTRQRPVWNGTEEWVPPLAIPEMSREIASHCLQRDPINRWTVSQIATRISSGALAPASVVAGRPPKRYGVAVAIGGLGGVAAVAAALFLGSHPAKQVPVPPQTAAPRTETPPPPQALAPPLEPPAPVAPSTSEKAAPVRGKVEHEVKPDVSAKALATIQGQVRVRVRVRVDPSGKVAETKLETPRVSRYFAGAALQAARGWRFAPPSRDGNAVSSLWLLEFDFGRGGAKMQAREQR